MKELIQCEFKNPSEEYLKKYLHYNPITGNITRTDVAKGLGSYDKDGYLIIKVKGKQFKSHRLALFLFYGKFPTIEIDHINRIRTDNRIENLRECTRQGNIKNTVIVCKSNTGILGIHFDKTKGLKKNYQVKIKNKTFRFYTIQEAINFKNENYGN